MFPDLFDCLLLKKVHPIILSVSPELALAVTSRFLTSGEGHQTSSFNLRIAKATISKQYQKKEKLHKIV